MGPADGRARIGIVAATTRDRRGRDLYAVKPSYAEAIRLAGGWPFALLGIGEDDLSEILGSVDGLLFPGGGDLPPELWGEAVEYPGETIPAGRAAALVSLARAGLESRLPVLGVCLGCQVMNVALGGSIIQDLPPPSDAVEHRSRGGTPSPHPVAVTPASRLSEALGVSRLTAASDHHQAIRKPGTGLKVVAVAPDNVIEGIEHAEAPFFVGVQWHPESALEEACNRRLFETFVRRAGSSRR